MVSYIYSKGYIKMGWFKDNNDEESSLPELPKILTIPKKVKEPQGTEKLPQLPSFPSNSFGDKFSQNAIKHAVSGEREVEEDEEEPEDVSNLLPRLPKRDLPPSEEIIGGIKIKRPLIQEIDAPEIKERTIKQGHRLKQIEPVFIRVDKFEEAMNLFLKAKKEISEIEHLLGETKKLKEKEEQELINWESEIKNIKQQIEKIDEDIFSKIE